MRLWQQVSIKHLVWVTRMTCWFLLKVEKITTKFIIKKLRKILEELLHSIFLRISLRWASMANISCTPLPYLTFIVSRLFCAGCLAAVQTDRWCLATPKQPWMQMQHSSFVCTIGIRAYCQLYYCLSNEIFRTIYQTQKTTVQCDILTFTIGGFLINNQKR